MNRALTAVSLVVMLLSVVVVTAMGFGTLVELYGWASGLHYNPVHLTVCPLIAGGGLVSGALAYRILQHGEARKTGA